MVQCRNIATPNGNGWVAVFVNGQTDPYNLQRYTHFVTPFFWAGRIAADREDNIHNVAGWDKHKMHNVGRISFILAALTGCSAIETRQAADPWGAIVGGSVLDLISCMGRPDSALRTGPHTAIVQWSHTQTDTGLTLAVPIIASLKIGGGGGCTMVATVLDDGTVAGVAFPASYTTGMLDAPDSQCGTLVRACLPAPPSTGLPRHFDEFRYLFPEVKP